jgi:hypothetical protein
MPIVRKASWMRGFLERSRLAWIWMSLGRRNLPERRASQGGEVYPDVAKQEFVEEEATM